MNAPRVTPASQIKIETHKLLLLQCAIIAAVTVFMFFYKSYGAMEAALYGGMIALVNTWISGRRTLAALNAEGGVHDVMILMIGVMQRFVFTIVFFIIGMLVLKLMPVPLLASFGLAQGAYFFSDAHKLRTAMLKNES
jgi:ATP synthase protein I